MAASNRRDIQRNTAWSKRPRSSSRSAGAAAASNGLRSATTQSMPRIFTSWRRKASRTSLFRKFLCEDSGVMRRVSAMPSLEAGPRPSAILSTIVVPRSLRGERSAGPKDPRAVKRWRLEKPSRAGLRAIAMLGDSDALAAFGAARIDDRAATGRLHAHAKAVRLLAVSIGRLESALHGVGVLRIGKCTRGNLRMRNSLKL